MRAVTAWHYPHSIAWEALPLVDLGGSTERALKQVIDEVAAAYPEVVVQAEVAQGSPAPVLLEAAK
jgi:hypothetical protein